MNGINRVSSAGIKLQVPNAYPQIYHAFVAVGLGVVLLLGRANDCSLFGCGMVCVNIKTKDLVKQMMKH